MNEKKICGILTEAVTDFESGRIHYIVLGIGINYSTSKTAFPKELSGIAGSLYEGATEDHISRNRLIAEIINQVFAVNERLESREFISEYKARSFVLGKEIRIIPTIGPDAERNFDEGIPATVMDIDGDGGLVVKYQDGTVSTLNSGEISIRTVC